MGFIDKDRIAIWGWVSFHGSNVLTSVLDAFADVAVF